MTSPPSSAFAPTASWDNLKLRARLLRQIREFFHARDFIEVETPILSADTVVDRHLDPLRVTLFDDPRSPENGRTLWLQTSPEFAMKRLLAAGGSALYQIAKAFRGGERGQLHNPEFTMVEWYRVGDDYEAGMRLLAELASTFFNASAQRLSYQQAFEQHLGLNPHRATSEELQSSIRARHTRTLPNISLHDRDSWLNLAFVTCVEPHIGQPGPTILYDFPASQSALARVRTDEFPVAERFELYAHGVELANGFHELLDPAVLRERQRQNNRERREDGKYLLPEENRLLQAMEQGLPNCTGVALGFDRLVMLAAHATQLSDVIAFPIEIA